MRPRRPLCGAATSGRCTARALSVALVSPTSAPAGCASPSGGRCRTGARRQRAAPVGGVTSRPAVVPGSSLWSNIQSSIARWPSLTQESTSCQRGSRCAPRACSASRRNRPVQPAARRRAAFDACIGSGWGFKRDVREASFKARGRNEILGRASSSRRVRRRWPRMILLTSHCAAGACPSGAARVAGTTSVIERAERDTRGDVVRTVGPNIHRTAGALEYRSPLAWVCDEYALSFSGIRS